MSDVVRVPIAEIVVGERKRSLGDLDDAQCAELMAMSQRTHAYEFIAG